MAKHWLQGGLTHRLLWRHSMSMVGRRNKSMRQSVRQRTDYIPNCAYDRRCIASLKISADEFANTRPVGTTKFT